MDYSRRRLLKEALFGSGMVGLRSIATGIPLSFFVSGFPRREALGQAASDAQFLILSANFLGDPFNTNAPGTYGVSGIVHNPHPEFSPTNIALGSTTTQAAAPWANLPSSVYARMNVVHHRTYQNAHSQFPKVLSLVGSARSRNGRASEHLASLFADELAPDLGTIQARPVSLRDDITFDGRVLQSIRPSTLASMFRQRGDRALELGALRDQTLDALHREMRGQASRQKRAWLDRYVLSKEQARAIDESLISRFAGINSNNAQAQVDAAVTLMLMRVSPVVQIALGFGGDNHVDPNLTVERDGGIAGFNNLNRLFNSLSEVGLADQVTFANLNVFGRTLGETTGRNHNLNHHVMMSVGKHVGAGVFGGVAPSGRDFGATAIDSVTGAGVEGGDIEVSQTLESAAKTLGRNLGIPTERLDARIEGGKYIQPALG